MSDWTCRCTAKNAEGARYCEGCGAENLKAPRHRDAVNTQETHRPWTPPVYPDPPATAEEARAALAKIKAILDALTARMTPP
jgi:hypothetical protein